MPSGMLLDYSFRRSALTKCVYWALVEKGNMAAVRRFHATSRVEGQELARLGLGVPITALPLGVDGEAWRIPPRPDELRQRCGSGARGRQIVLFLGRLHPVKGLVDLLLPAFSRLKADAFLAVVGGPDAHAPGHDKQVRAAVDRLQLRGRVALLGSVPPQERWALFDGAAVFVLPSHSENFGIVVAEAMARGCQVVVSDAVQAAEHVRAAEAGRVVPPAIDPLAEAIDAELSAPALRSQQGAHGQRYAASVLAWDRIAEQIFAMYKSVRGSAARVG
jgi:glycosyltransferase involved in cell wall biosynthesis